MRRQPQKTILTKPCLPADLPRTTRGASVTRNMRADSHQVMKTTGHIWNQNLVKSDTNLCPVLPKPAHTYHTRKSQEYHARSCRIRLLDCRVQAWKARLGESSSTPTAISRTSNLHPEEPGTASVCLEEPEKTRKNPGHQCPAFSAMEGPGSTFR